VPGSTRMQVTFSRYRQSCFLSEWPVNMMSLSLINRLLFFISEYLLHKTHTRKASSPLAFSSMMREHGTLVQMPSHSTLNAHTIPHPTSQSGESYTQILYTNIYSFFPPPPNQPNALPFISLACASVALLISSFSSLNHSSPCSLICFSKCSYCLCPCSRI